VSSAWIAIVRVPARVLIALVRVYQWTVSPLLGPSCRFHPTCSSYACVCLRDHGALRGGWLTVRRLSRCHPWHPGGLDLPPPIDGLGPAPRRSAEHLEAPVDTRAIGGSSS
jgi:uncharacterized protein